MAGKRAAGGRGGQGFGVPTLPLPEPTLSDEPGSWAFDTMSRRVNEEILRGMVMTDNEADLSDAARERLTEFSRELECAGETTLRPIAQDGGADVDAWNAILSQYEGLTWLTAPWVVTEYYFYRRILEACGYFAGELGDPFERQKENGLASCAPALSPLAKLANGACASRTDKDVELNFKALLLTSLWGNRMDLSIWPAETEEDVESGQRAAEAMAEVIGSSSTMLLADHSERVWLEVSRRGGRMDLVLDNAGFELVTDLCLADFLVTSGLASKVVLHAKAYPVFVSDAMEKDVLGTIRELALAQGTGMEEAAARWRGHIEHGRWEVREDEFWCTPLAFWEMPDRITSHLEGSRMCFVKGDANYRRQLGERQWKHDTPFEDVSAYWGCPVCCLRTMKSEVACGISREDERRASEEDGSWLVSGRYGVVHART